MIHTHNDPEDKPMHMSRFFFSAASAVALSAACGTAGATEVSTVVELAKSAGCYSCHANAEKIVGPAFAKVAEKYAGQKDAAADLALSIQNGSSGKWGRIPMPGHPSLAAADVKRLAEWVLTVK